MTESQKVAQFEGRIRTLEQWQAEHGGREEARWEAQVERNKAVDEKLSELGNLLQSVMKELVALKVRVAMFSAGAAMLGTALGTILARYFVK